MGAELKPKHEAVMRKAAAAIRARGHEGDARLADSLLGIVASMQQPAATPAQGALSDAADSARLDFMIAEQCIVDSDAAVQDQRFWLSWPYHYCEQSEVFATPREAIDAAIQAQAVDAKGGAA